MKLRAAVLVSMLAVVGAAASAASAQGGPIMPLSQVTPGMNCTGYTVILGTTISSFNVSVLGVVDGQAPDGGPGILVQVSGPAVAGTGIAAGFSGSPMLCPGPGGTMETAGAISESVPSSDNSVGIATPIEAMLGEPVTPPTSAISLKLHPKELAGPLTVGGISPPLFSLAKRIARRYGRVLVAGPSRPAADYPVQPLVPGASVAVGYSTGAVAAGAIGTVTYVNGPDIYAFGHPFDSVGRRSLFLQDAYVYDVVSAGLLGSIKLATPGHTEGTLTADTPNAVIGVQGAPPPSIPVNVTARDIGTGKSISLRTQVADETDVGLPLGSSLVDLIAPLEVGEAAFSAYASGAPANESGSMCLSIYLRETRAPLGFCNRYVGSTGFGGGYLANGTASDAATAFSLLDSVRFATLHVTSVVATISAGRGLSEADIIGSHGPAKVRAGALVRVRLDVRRYRGAQKTILLRIRIPRSAHGRLVMRIRGVPLTPSFALGGGPGGPGGPGGGPGGPGGGPGSGPFGGGPGAPAPGSLRALRALFSQIAPYDGLTLSVGHRRYAIYRDPTLLIDGATTLRFTVR